jgi:hypothetical protein
VIGAILHRAKREGLAECRPDSHGVRRWIISEAGRLAIRQ